MISSQSTNSSTPIKPKPQTYRVIKLVGEGSFGRVYLVECNSDNVT